MCAVLFSGRCCALEALEGLARWPGRGASRAAGLTVGLCATSKAASGFVLLPFQTKPRWRMSIHRPAFIWCFEEPSCWDRPELRKTRAKWKLILVWLPEMAAALWFLPLLWSFCPQSSHSIPMLLRPFARWFWEFSLLMACRRWSERARCSLLLPYYYGVLFAFMEANGC